MRTRWLIFAWAFALPLHRPPFPLPIERTGVGEWLFPLALACALPILVRAIRDRDRELRNLAIVPLLFLVGFAVPVACAIDRRAAIVQLGILLYVSSIFLLAYTLSRAGHHAPILQGLIGGSFLMAIIAWAMPQHVPELTSSLPRPGGLAESPNMIAIQCCVAILAIVLLWRSSSSTITTGDRRWFVPLIIFFFAITALATFGHVAIVGVATVVFVLSRIAKAPIHRRLLQVALAGSVLFILASLRVRFFPLSSAPPFIDTRPPLYVPPHALALDMFMAHPLTGVGLECFGVAWPTFFDVNHTRFLASYSGFEDRLGVPLDPHSTWLGYLAEAGIFGALVLASLVALFVRAARRVDRGSGLKAATMCLHAALFFVLGISLFLDVLTSRELALTFGVLFAVQNRELVR